MPSIEASGGRSRRAGKGFISALMRSLHELHGVLDMTPLAGLFGLAFAFASNRVLRRLGDGRWAMPLEHLPRDGVDLHLGRHGALLRCFGDQIEPVPRSCCGLV